LCHLRLPDKSGRDDPSQRAKVLAVADDVTSCKAGDDVYVFINDGTSIERLYRTKERPDQGDIKFYKGTAILCVAEDVSVEEDTTRPLDVIEAFGIEDLLGIKENAEHADESAKGKPRIFKPQ